MGARIGTGLVSAGGVEAFAEAASRAADGLGGAQADLVLVFAGAPIAEHVEDGLEAVLGRLGAPALIGCGAQGVVAGGRELESGGIAVWAASLPDATVETFHLEAVAAGESQLAVSGMPDLDGMEAVILLVDPWSFPVEPVLGQIAEDHPGLPVVGGLASLGSGSGGLLLRDGAVRQAGAVGVALGGVDVRPCVSQGARPIGPEMVITAAEGNVIEELASRPALDRLKEAIGELEPAERALAAQGLLLGIVVDENQPEYERGDFLVRGLLSIDEDAASITVGERVRIGQTVRMQVRDGPSADEDLTLALERQAREMPTRPAGALLFTCNGRGAHMFGTADHDAGAFERTFGGAPAAGFFCAGEIGPVGDRNFVHGFTATLALFAG